MNCCVEVIVDLSIVTSHVHPFMTIIYHGYFLNWINEHDNLI